MKIGLKLLIHYHKKEVLTYAFYLSITKSKTTVNPLKAAIHYPLCLFYYYCLLK